MSIFVCQNKFRICFPKEERKILGRDKYIVGSLVLTPVILWGILLLVYLGSVSTPLDVSLEYGEYSDGTVVFRAPENAFVKRRIRLIMCIILLQLVIAYGEP